MRIPLRLILASSLLLSSAISSRALAAWPHDITGTTLTPFATGTQTAPAACIDGSGGAIVAWINSQSGAADIYAQRVNFAGQILWTSGGVAVSTAAGDQVKVRVAEDGLGGAYLAWEDQPFNSEIVCQHLNAAGAIVAGWPVNGLAITAVAGDQDQPSIVADGLGGAFVAWHDYRSGNADIYVHRLVAGGVAPGWPANGLAVCVQPGDQGPVSIASDGFGSSAWVAWHDGRNQATTGADIYMQRVLSNATVQWSANGVLVCGVTSNQTTPVLGAGQGATIVWTDQRNSAAGNGADLYSNFVTGSGSVNFSGGLAVASGVGDQVNPALVAVPGTPMTIAAWEDRAVVDAQGQRGDIKGSILNQGVAGTVSGPAVALCTRVGTQTAPFGIYDGAGGAIFVWSDYRGGAGASDVYAQRLGSNGQALWTVDGVIVTNFGNDEPFSWAVPDGRGGALVAYTRNVSGTFYTALMARMDHFGFLGSPEPVISSAKDVRSDQGGLVHLTWNASYLDTDPSFTIGSYHVWRRLTGLSAQRRIERTAASGPSESGLSAPTLRTIGSQTWEYLGSLPARGYGSYSFPAATLADSATGGAAYTVFMVDAQAASGPSFWSSYADSGYSVDNLAPAMPTPFSGSYLAGATHLSWGRNGEADLAGYRIYRGTSGSFVPGPGNLIAAPPDTGYADAGSAGSWYKLSAIDSHGNESPYATLSPGGTVDVPAPAVTAFYFAPVAPNPVRDASTLVFGLPAAAQASLVVFNVSGRAVRHLVSGSQTAGRHAVSWDGRDDQGSAVASGLYFARLVTGVGSDTRRVVVER